jgi:hypothetical protein
VRPGAPARTSLDALTAAVGQAPRGAQGYTYLCTAVRGVARVGEPPPRGAPWGEAQLAATGCVCRLLRERLGLALGRRMPGARLLAAVAVPHAALVVFSALLPRPQPQPRPGVTRSQGTEGGGGPAGEQGRASRLLRGSPAAHLSLVLERPLPAPSAGGTQQAAAPLPQQHADGAAMAQGLGPPARAFLSCLAELVGEQGWVVRHMAAPAAVGAAGQAARAELGPPSTGPVQGDAREQGAPPQLQPLQPAAEPAVASGVPSAEGRAPSPMAPRPPGRDVGAGGSTNGGSQAGPAPRPRTCSTGACWATRAVPSPGLLLRGRARPRRVHGGGCIRGCSPAAEGGRTFSRTCAIQPRRPLAQRLWSLRRRQQPRRRGAACWAARPEPSAPPRG